MRNPRGWREPPWFDQPGARVRFLHQLRGLAGVKVGGDPGHRSGFAVSFTVNVTGLPPRRVSVQFRPRNPSVPLVFVDGPADSPHRYGDGNLCMWYPEDARDLVWAPPDGAADLVARIAVHLLKEEHFRETGDWVGPEVAH